MKHDCRCRGREGGKQGQDSSGGREGAAGACLFAAPLRDWGVLGCRSIVNDALQLSGSTGSWPPSYPSSALHALAVLQRDN